MSLYMCLWVIALCSLALNLGALAEQCGSQAGGALCPGGLCCSKYGYCGTTADYCSNGCQSQCGSGVGSPPPPPPPAPGEPSTPSSPAPTPGGDIVELISQELFEEILKHRNDDACPAKGFYTYDAFLAAANSFGAFGTTGNTTTRKREIAAFLAQTSHETTGGWPTAPDGPYAWGYCFKEEVGNPGDYCVLNEEWPCVPGKKYYGRGPIQLSYNYNYGPAGEAINVDLLSDPDAVANDATISFETAFWFWMTPQSPKPSCHDVIVGNWQPSAADIEAGRVPGYGVLTNIINGGIECGRGSNAQMEDRIGYYKRYCDILGIDYGDNLDCSNQRPFNA